MDAVVELVDVELVVDEGVDGGEAAGEGGSRAGLADVELIGEAEAGEGYENGDCGET